MAKQVVRVKLRMSLTRYQGVWPVLMAPGASGDFGGQRRDVAVAAALLPSPSCWGHTLRSPLINLQSYFQTTFSTTFSPERVPPQTTSSGDLEALPPIEQLFM
jgi:hypothetical protein